MCCCKASGKRLEHERGLGRNTRRCRMFLLTCWVKIEVILSLYFTRQHTITSLKYRGQNYFLLRGSKTHAVAQFCRMPFQCSFCVNKLKNTRISWVRFYFCKTTPMQWNQACLKTFHIDKITILWEKLCRFQSVFNFEKLLWRFLKVTQSREDA